MKDIKLYKLMSGHVFRPIYPYLCESAFQRSRIQPQDAEVVDLGGGSGLWLEAMFQKGIKKGTLVDVSAEMVETAQSLLGDNYSEDRFEALVGGADNIPLQDSSCNLIISRSSMHMWSNLDKCWQEIYRILKKGGSAFLGRGYGPDLPEEIRRQVKADRKKIRAKKAEIAKEEPPSPDPFELGAKVYRLGFKEVSIIRDARAWWILAIK
ncbi:MAG: class I SAM-dependent methyltransferase [Candidatus Rifleibacteriota bacterium]